MNQGKEGQEGKVLEVKELRNRMVAAGWLIGEKVSGLNKRVTGRESMTFVSVPKNGIIAVLSKLEPFF